MNKITSSTNPTIKHLRKLAKSPLYRREHSQTILDGIHLCQSYLQAGLVPERVIISPTALEDSEVQILVKQLPARVEVIEVTDSLTGTISRLENGVGLLFVINIPQTTLTKINSSALLLDQIQDPGNLGTILRTAVASGIGSVYLSPGTVGAWSPKVLRAGMGAHFALDIFESAELAHLIGESDIPVLATSLTASLSLYDYDLRSDKVWLFGNEGAGVSPELLALCHETLTIPQSGAIESLNVASAVAVCLFEQRRQQLQDN